MLSIALFAIIGAMLKPGVAYWILFGFYCAFSMLKVTISKD